MGVPPVTAEPFLDSIPVPERKASSTGGLKTLGFILEGEEEKADRKENESGYGGSDFRSISIVESPPDIVASNTSEITFIQNGTFSRCKTEHFASSSSDTCGA